MKLVRGLTRLRLNHYYRQSLRINKAEHRLEVTSTKVTYLRPTPMFDCGWRGMAYRYKYYLELFTYDLQCFLIHVWIGWLRLRIKRNSRNAERLVRRHPQLFKKV